MAADWGIVGYGADPIPDDPGIVAAQVDHIKAVAADLAAQVAALPTDGAIDAVPWQSDTGAPEHFKQVVKKLPADLDKLRVRYGKVGAAMGAFQAVLANAKAQAQANLTKAVAAHNDIAVATAGVAQMNDFTAQAQHQANAQNSSAPPGTPPVHPHAWTGPDYHAQLAAAQSAFNAAKAAIDQAVSQFHQAAKTAAAAVGAASHDDLKNDTSIWGSIVHGVESAAHWVAQRVPLQAISGLLTKIATVASILSFIPVIGQVADTIALIAVGGVLLCDTITSLNDAYEGTFGWHDGLTLGIDVVGFGAGFVARGATATADAAMATADGSRAIATTAQSAAREAAAAQASAQVARDAASARLVNLTEGNWFKVTGARILGMTGRANTAVQQAATTLDQSVVAAEQAARAARAAQVTAAADANYAKAAQSTAVVARATNDVMTGGSQVNSIANEPVGTWNPAVAAARSTTLEVNGLVHWNDDPAGSAALSLGSQLPAQPIPVPSGG